MFAAFDNTAQGWQHGQAALKLARQRGEPEAIFNAVHGLFFLDTFLSIGMPEEMDAFFELALELSPSEWRRAPLQTQASFLLRLAPILLAAGEKDRAGQALSELESLADRTQDPFAKTQAALLKARFSFVDGRLEATADICQALSEGEQVRVGAETILMHVLVYFGRPHEALDLVGASNRRLDLIEGPSVRARRAFCLAHAGELEAARATLVSETSHVGGDNVQTLSYLLQTAALLGERTIGGELAIQLAPAASNLLGSWTECPARLLGVMAALLGKPDEARAYYNQALEVCAKIRFRPEIALTRLGLAELLLEHYPDERVTAIEHLDFAIAEFGDMKMQPSLERALRHRGLLKA